MTNTTVSKARQDFPDLLNRASYGKERIVIEKHGKPIAVIISPEDLQRLEAFEDAVDSALLKRAMAQSTGFVTAEELLSMRPID